MSTCNDEIRLTNICLILSQKELYTEYAENRELNRLEFKQTWRTMKSKILALSKTSPKEAEMGITEEIMHPDHLYSQMIHSCC